MFKCNIISAKLIQICTRLSTVSPLLWYKCWKIVETIIFFLLPVTSAAGMRQSTTRIPSMVMMVGLWPCPHPPGTAKSPRASRHGRPHRAICTITSSHSFSPPPCVARDVQPSETTMAMFKQETQLFDGFNLGKPPLCLCSIQEHLWDGASPPSEIWNLLMLGALQGHSHQREKWTSLEVKCSFTKSTYRNSHLPIPSPWKVQTAVSEFLLAKLGP